MAFALHLPARVRPFRDQTRLPRVAFFLETGGASRFWSTAIPKVAAHGFEPILVTLRHSGTLHDELVSKGIRTVSLSSRGVRDYPWKAMSLGQLLRRERVDILQSYESIQAAIGGLALTVAPHTIHAFHRQHMQISVRAQQVLSAIGTRLSHYTLACSHATAQWVREAEHVPAKKVEVATYGVPHHRDVASDEIGRLRADHAIPPEAHVVLLAGYLREEKGHRVLLEALPLIRAALNRPVHVVFVGKGPEECTLKERCVGDAAIHFAGYQHDIAPWFALADVVAMPSHYEAFGLVAVEAFAASRPLVASDIGGLREVVDESGILVSPGDARALANAVIAVLSSPSRARALAAAGYQRFERLFTVDAMVNGWIRFYKKALDLRSPGIVSTDGHTADRA